MSKVIYQLDIIWNTGEQTTYEYDNLYDAVTSKDNHRNFFRNLIRYINLGIVEVSDHEKIK